MGTRSMANFQAISPAEGDWKTYAPGTAYNCEVHFVQKPSGGFTAIAARLPSLTAEGATVEEAKDAILVRLTAWLKEQKTTGGVRWADEKREPKGGDIVRAYTVEIG